MPSAMRVSIRAPARGATRDGTDDLFFNPRPRTGGDTAVRTRGTVSHRFNPRPRTGGDMRGPRAAAARLSFNPRPRTGGDVRHDVRSRSDLTGCFNPRPRTGGDAFATNSRRIWFNRGAGFNPRPRTGGDDRNVQRDPRELRTVVSIRAPARGATDGQRRRSAVEPGFQSAPPHGGRL